MSDDRSDNNAMLELTVKITEVAGDVKVIREVISQFMVQSEKVNNTTTRRLDKHDEELDLVKLQISEHKTTMRVLKVLFTGLMSVIVTAAAVLALVLH